MSVLSFISALRKDVPATADVHVSTALGNAKPPKKAKPFKAIIGEVSQDMKLPVTGADLAAQLEDGQSQVGKADHPRMLKPIDDSTAHSPFPFDAGALAHMRADQTPRFLGALTDQESLPTKTVPMQSLVAMQNRVDPAKVEAMRGAGDATKPPLVVRVGGRNMIADGHHRAAAAWLDGKQSIPVKFKDLEPEDNALKRFFDKAGARHSKSDIQLLQTVHDHVCSLGAECDAGNVRDDASLADTTKRDSRWSRNIEIAKLDDDKHLVFGWASIVHKDGSVVEDMQGDIISPADLEDAVYPYVMERGHAGEMHERSIGVGKLVESMVMTVEKQKAMGLPEGSTPLGWWVGYKLAPDVFAKVKSGEYAMFSIGGGGNRVPVSLTE